jgi:signal transduction histidine kinase
MYWQERIRAIAGKVFIQLDEETLVLWRKYQLGAAPWLLAVISLLSGAIAVRNYLSGTASIAGLVIILGLLLCLALANWLFKQYLLRMVDVLSVFILPAIIYQYFSWPAGQPSPALLGFPMAMMFQAAANNVRIATVYLLTGLVLLIHNSSGLDLNVWSNTSWVIAVGSTLCMIYASSIILWLRLIKLFNTRVGLLASIRQSIEVRRSLLDIFYDEISGPLESLIEQVDAPVVDWFSVSAINQTLSQAIGKAREITLDVGRKLNFAQQNLGKEIEQIRQESWVRLVYSAAGVTLLLFIVYLAGPWPIRVPILVSFPITLILARAAKAGVYSPRLARLSLYVLTALIAWSCYRRLAEGEQIYLILYFMVVIFSAVIISGIMDAILVACVAETIILWWYLQVPVLPPVVTVIRSNLIVVLLFTTSFSVIMGYWLARIMEDINAKEQKLRIETDLRQRLMATLFHDVSNPLQVIITRAEFVQMGISSADDVVVVKDLACKIRGLLEVTRELEELDVHEKSLPLEPVALSEVFDDLRQIFSGRLAAKNLVLQIVPSNQSVLAHRAILSMSVFANLLTNALKFSPRGGTIRIVTSADDKDMLCVSIMDEGAGIPAAAVAKMHNNEPMESARGTEGEEGHGQGLCLVSLYLAKMGGRLELEDTAAVKVHLQSAGLVQP